MVKHYMAWLESYLGFCDQELMDFLYNWAAAAPFAQYINSGHTFKYIPLIDFRVVLREQSGALKEEARKTPPWLSKFLRV